MEAEEIALRPFRVDDAAAVAKACGDPAILRFTFMQDGLTEAEAAEWINRTNERWADGHPRFAIVDPDDDRLLCLCAHHPRRVSGVSVDCCRLRNFFVRKEGVGPTREVSGYRSEAVVR